VRPPRVELARRNTCGQLARALTFFKHAHSLSSFYLLYLVGPSGGHLLRCVGPIPPAGVLLDSSSPVPGGALCLSGVASTF
jgi:hypothetical protein